jgi:hypothetical protein
MALCLGGAVVVEGMGGFGVGVGGWWCWQVGEEVRGWVAVAVSLDGPWWVSVEG